jgi:hypothetical protein
MHKKSYIPPPRSNPFSLLPNTNDSDNNDDAEDTGTSDNNSNKDGVVNKDVINKDSVDDKDVVDGKDGVDVVDGKDVVDFKVYYSKKDDNRDGGRSNRDGGRINRDGGRINRDGGRINRDGGRINRDGGHSYGDNKNTFGGGWHGDVDSRGGWRGDVSSRGGWRGDVSSRGAGRYDNNFKRTSDSQNMNNVEPLQYVFSDVPDNIGDIAMNNNYRVLAHHNADSNWNFDSYHHVSTLKKWKDVPKLFNTLNETKYSSKITDFDFFIMKNEISPLWEDEENRCGSICSIKIDTLKDGYNILKTLFVHICNNTLMNITKNNVPNWNIINGVSFSCKKVENISSIVEQDYSMIKIWFKTNYTQFENIDKYFNDDINALLKRYSIKVRAIKPEY